MRKVINSIDDDNEIIEKTDIKYGGISMKNFILKNKKGVSAVLILLSILFVILIITNLSSSKRSAYQAMYDTNEALYDTYVDYGNKFSGYGYSSKANEMYSKSQDIKYKMDNYGNKLATMNTQVVVFAILTVGSIGSAILLLKSKTI